MGFSIRDLYSIFLRFFLDLLVLVVMHLWLEFCLFRRELSEYFDSEFRVFYFSIPLVLLSFASIR